MCGEGRRGGVSVGREGKVGQGQCVGREGGAGSVWGREGKEGRGQCGGGKGRRGGVSVGEGREGGAGSVWGREGRRGGVSVGSVWEEGRTHVRVLLGTFILPLLQVDLPHIPVCDDTSAQLNPHPPFHMSSPLSLYPPPIYTHPSPLYSHFSPSLCFFPSFPPPVPPLCSRSSPSPPLPLSPSRLPGLPIRSILPCPELLVDVYVGGDRVHTDGMQGAIFLHSANTHHKDIVTLPTLPHTLA